MRNALVLLHQWDPLAPNGLLRQTQVPNRSDCAPRFPDTFQSCLNRLPIPK